MYDRNNYILTDSAITSDLLRLFNKNENLNILDIGGCEGEESIRYSRLFPNASIVVFEPLPKNQILIENNINKYNATNVKLLPIALSDKSGIEKFYVSSGQPEEQKENLDWDFGNKSSSLLPPDRHTEMVPWIKFKEAIDVRTENLQNVLGQLKINVVDFIHMDVQGAELKVLTGAGGMLKNIKAIWLEVADIKLYKDQPIRMDIEKFMKENNFFLVKTNLYGGVGDQMYLNRRYFKRISMFFLKKYIRRKFKND